MKPQIPLVYRLLVTSASVSCSSCLCWRASPSSSSCVPSWFFLPPSLQASLSPLQPPVTIILFYSPMGSTVSVPTLKRDLLAFLFSHSIYSLQNSTISKAKWSLILHIFYVCFLLHLLVADGYPLGWLQSIGEFFCGLVLPDFSSLSLRFTSGKSFPPV